MNVTEEKKSFREVPRHTFTEALRLVNAFKDDSNSKSVKRINLAQRADTTPSSTIFRDLISSANKYGLIEGNMKSEHINLSGLGASICYPKSDEERSGAIKEAILRPKVFEELVNFYKDKKLPSSELVMNTITEQFGVDPKIKKLTYDIFIANSEEYGFIKDIKGSKYVQIPDGQLVVDNQSVEEVPETDEEPQTSEEVDLPTQSVPEVTRPKKVFIAHGKNKVPLEQLKQILSKFKVASEVVMENPHEGKPISQKVLDTMKECTSGIFIFTADEEFTDKNGNPVLMPNINVVFELGAGISLYGNKIVIFREEGVTFGSDFTAIGHISFEKDKLNTKGAELLQELINLGFLTLTPT